jgi:hypothetical protein
MVKDLARKGASVTAFMRSVSWNGVGRPGAPGGGQGADYRQAGAAGQEGWPGCRALFLDRFKRCVELSKVSPASPPSTGSVG